MMKLTAFVSGRSTAFEEESLSRLVRLGSLNTKRLSGKDD